MPVCSFDEGERLIVSTGLGSTALLKSILTGSMGANKYRRRHRSTLTAIVILSHLRSILEQAECLIATPA